MDMNKRRWTLSNVLTHCSDRLWHQSLKTRISRQKVRIGLPASPAPMDGGSKNQRRQPRKNWRKNLLMNGSSLRRPVVPDGLPKLNAGKSSPKCMSAQLASLSTSALPVVAPCAPLFLPNPDYKLHHRAPDTAPRIDWLALHE